MDFYVDEKENKVVYGPNFDGHIGRLTLKILKDNDEKINQIDIESGEQETNGSVRKRSIRTAKALKSKGLKLGDKILICTSNHMDSSLPLLACFYIGTIPVNLAVGMSHYEVKHLTALAKPSIAFVDKSMSQLIRAVLSEMHFDIEIVVFDKDVDDAFTSFENFIRAVEADDDFICENFDPNTTTLLASCSSGTTGLPKLVAITHKAMCISMGNFSRRLFNLIYLSFSPMFWITGIVAVLFSSLTATTRVQTRNEFTPELAKYAIETYKPNLALLSPVALYDLWEYLKDHRIDFSSFQTIYCGGSAFNKFVMEEVKKVLPIAFVYAATETGSVCYNFNNNNHSMGKIYPHFKWKVVDVDSEEILGPNSIGELRLKSETLFKEYIGNPEATIAAYDNEGYYKTGDSVMYDENGFIYIIDRLKDLIKYKNYQVTPAELEAVICTIPEVSLVAVIGVPEPICGELPMAFVQLKPGCKVSEKQIKDLVKDSLSDAKQLRGGVVFVEKIPVTYSGKIDKKELKKFKISLV